MLGLAIDYGRSVTVKGALQHAMDTSALVGAMHYRDHGDQAKAITMADAYLKKNYHNPHGAPITSLSYTIDDSKLAMRIDATATLQTTFAKLMHVDTIPVKDVSIAQAEGKELELGLMLDITGSMDETSGKGDLTSKITDLKLALKDLLDIFEKSMEKKKVKIGFAPFSEGVKGGARVEELRGKQPDKKKVGSITYRLTDCVTERENGDRYTDAYGGMSPHYNESGTCATKVTFTALTDKRSTLDSAISALKTGGVTSGHLGTAWAWYLISPQWQSFFGVTLKQYKDKKNVKAVILMTDGEYNMQYCLGVSDKADKNCKGIESGSQAKELCSEMKKLEIVVYTIGFDLDTAYSKDVLGNCASPGKYFPAYSGDQLRAAFVQIGKELLDKVRLTQ